MALSLAAAAAGELGVTPAAVGSQIRALEKRLDRPLFQRGPNGLVPVDAAREAADRLTRGFAILSDVEQSLSACGGSRQVALTVSQTFAETWLPRHLPTLFARRGLVAGRDDALARDPAHRPQDLLVPNASAGNLRLDHMVPFGGHIGHRTSRLAVCAATAGMERRQSAEEAAAPRPSLLRTI